VTEFSPDVREYYEKDKEAARLNAGHGQLEFVRTQEIIRRYLPPPPLRILDIGGAAGVHAAWLADDGHTVHLIDPMPNHVEAARRLGNSARRITADIGDARNLAVDEDSVDAVLLLGPLYHLTERTDRVQALREARRVVRPGGYVFAAAISRFASLIDGLGTEWLFDPRFCEIVERDLHDGQHRNPDQVSHWFTTAYFHHPSELPVEATDAGLACIAVLGVEGAAGWFRNNFEKWNDPAVRAAMLFAARATESEATLIGASAHLVMIAQLVD
jgi:ubiquinone/menaquinone biosynthesis C-methylase UbiE